MVVVWNKNFQTSSSEILILKFINHFIIVIIIIPEKFGRFDWSWWVRLHKPQRKHSPPQTWWWLWRCQLWGHYSVWNSYGFLNFCFFWQVSRRNFQSSNIMFIITTETGMSIMKVTFGRCIWRSRILRGFDDWWLWRILLSLSKIDDYDYGVSIE